MEAADAADSVLHGDLLECVLLRVPHGELTASPALVSREWRRAARRRTSATAGAGGTSLPRGARPRRRRWRRPLHARVRPARRGVGLRWVARRRALPVRRCACAGGDRVYALSSRPWPSPRTRSAPRGASCRLRGCGVSTRSWRRWVPTWSCSAAGAGRRRPQAWWRFLTRVQGGRRAADAGAVGVEVGVIRRLGRRVYVVERRTGWASWFDPAARQWGPARQLQLPEGNNTASVESWAACGVTTSGGGGASERLLVLAGGGGGKVSLWGVDGDTLLLDAEANNTSMPPEMSERLGGAGSIAAAAAARRAGTCTTRRSRARGR